MATIAAAPKSRAKPKLTPMAKKIKAKMNEADKLPEIPESLQGATEAEQESWSDTWSEPTSLKTVPPDNHFCRKCKKRDKCLTNKLAAVAFCGDRTP